MRRRTKLAVVLPLVLLVLAGVGVSGTWMWASNALRGSYETWRAERRAEGYRFQNADPAVGGFPFEVTARMARPAVAAPPGWRWQGPAAVTGRAGVLSPFTLRLTAPGTHTLVTPAGRRLTAEAEGATGRVLFAPGTGARSGQMTLQTVELSGLPAGPTSAEALFVALGPARRPADSPRELDFVVEADGVALPEDVRTVFGRHVDRLAARGTAVGRAPRQLTAAELHAWRQRGGALRLDHLELAWAPLELSGGGTLTLDDRLRPKGALDVSVTGLGPALERLADAGRLDRDTVRYAKLAISALGSTDERTGKTAIDLTLSFRDGRLYLGPVMLARLSPVLVDRTSRLGGPGRPPA